MQDEKSEKKNTGEIKNTEPVSSGASTGKIDMSRNFIGNPEDGEGDRNDTNEMEDIDRKDPDR